MIAVELTSEQEAIVSAGINGPRLVDAGAGTGKTFTMIERVRALVEGGFAPDALLLVTFTNAAASELATRLESVFTSAKHADRRAALSTRSQATSYANSAIRSEHRQTCGSSTTVERAGSSRELSAISKPAGSTST